LKKEQEYHSSRNRNKGRNTRNRGMWAI